MQKGGLKFGAAVVDNFVIIMYNISNYNELGGKEMKKRTSIFALLLALIMAFSCLAIPASALNSTVVKKPDNTTFYQGVDWMYSKDGEIILMKGGLNMSGAVLSYNNKTVEYKKTATGPNMYAKCNSDAWCAGKNVIRIYCDSFDSVYALCDVYFATVKKISLVRAPKTKLVVGQEWSMGINKDVEMTKYDLTGTVIRAEYDDSAIQTVSAPNACLNWSIPENEEVIMPGDHTLYITFCGQKAPFSVVFITETKFSKGDVSLDGRINAYDALNVLQSATGLITLSPTQIGLADVDGNSKINSADALFILQYIVGLRESL